MITTDGGASPNDTVDWDGDGRTEAYEPEAGSDVLPPIQPGDRVSVRLVDIDGDVVFFRASLTA